MWTDEKKQQAIDMYLEAGPTPENTVEILQQVAEELEEIPNGVRTILSKAGAYVKKTPASGGASKAASGEKSTRTNKADALAKLTDVISEAGAEVDEAIIEKLTGKAALYFASVISSIAK